MAPANRKSQYVKALSSFTYTRSEDGSPLRPSEPLLQTMYYRDLKTWVHKQDPQFPEFIEYGYVSTKGVTYTVATHLGGATNRSAKQWRSPRRWGGALCGCGRVVICKSRSTYHNYLVNKMVLSQS